MTRLPKPGSDSGHWGDILNDFLAQAHNADGSLKDNSVGDSQLQTESVIESTLSAAVQTKLNRTAPVTKVNDQTGDVTLTQTDIGLSNVDNTSDAAKPISSAQQAALDLKADLTALSSMYAPIDDSRFGLDPDTFTGTDFQKVQTALDYSIANGFPSLIFRRQFDITGEGTLSINKAAYSDRSVLTMMGHGGGITKTDAGAIFTSAITNMGDLSVVGMRWVSTPGAGTIVWDGDKLIRISSLACEYRGVDRVLLVGSGRWVQSAKFIDEHIIAGEGYAFMAPETIEMTIQSCLIEDRTGGLFSNGTDLGALQNRTLRIIGNVLENCIGTSGTPIVLASCWNADISGNYFESNFANTMTPQIDLHTLCATVGQFGLSLRNNQYTLSTYQKANNASAVWIGRTNSNITSQGNVSDGILYDLRSASGSVTALGGDYSGSSKVILHAQHNDRYAAPATNLASDGGVTSQRPLPPRTRQQYFDTTLGKPIWCSSVGTRPQQGFTVTAGATASGNITVNLYLTTPLVVAVNAGDSPTQVAAKIAASTVIGWSLGIYLSTRVTLTRDIPQGASLPTVNVASTGVTVGSIALDVVTAAPIWVDAAGTAV